jgi:hypothetical protein
MQQAYKQKPLVRQSDLSSEKCKLKYLAHIEPFSEQEGRFVYKVLKIELSYLVIINHIIGNGRRS